MQFRCCSTGRVQLFTIIVATIVIITILITLFVNNYPSIARKRLIEGVVFKNGSEEIERFKTTADLRNLRTTFYIYNVTNADEVVRSSARIKVQEVGPFTYHEFKTKEFVVNDQEAGLITYKLRKQYTFLPDKSVGNPKELRIVWPNVPLIVAQAYLDKLRYPFDAIAYRITNLLISSFKEPAFISDTVDNFLFSGSKREFFVKLQNLTAHLIKPWPLKDNKFALLYDKNNTWYPDRDFLFTVAAGFGTNQTFRDINEYKYMNGSSTLPFWLKEPPNCNRLHGTDGQFFSPLLNTSDTLTVYTPDLCRTIDLQYNRSINSFGFPTYKYSIDPNSFKSGSNFQENSCYCLNKSSYECKLDGLVDLSSCVAPNMFASGSHFIYGSPELLSRIDGIRKPNSTDEPMLIVEPNTGLTLQVRIPFQINTKLQKGRLQIFNFFKDQNPLIVPLVYTFEAAELEQDQASMLRNQLLLLDSWFVFMVLGGAILLVLAIFVSFVVVCLRVRRSSTREPDQATSSVRSASREPSETDPLLANRQ